MKKWDFQGDDSFLTYPIVDSKIALRVFQTFQKSIDPIRQAQVVVKTQANEESEQQSSIIVVNENLSIINQSNDQFNNNDQIMDDQVPPPLPYYYD